MEPRSLRERGRWGTQGAPRKAELAGGERSVGTRDPIRVPASGMARKKAAQRTRNHNEQNDKPQPNARNAVAGHVQ
jgi:hypothetical protein